MARFFVFTLLVFGIATSAARLPIRDNSACAQWCAANFAQTGKDCTSKAAQGKGPCYECGPLATSPTKKLCQGTCTDSSSDSKNCGSCGNVCASGKCTGGVCAPICDFGQTSCNGACVNTNADLYNCGGCGITCSLCFGGVCYLV